MSKPLNKKYLPSKYFVMLINATMGSGKTSLICNLIKAYKAEYKNIIYLAPSNDDGDKIKHCGKVRVLQLTREILAKEIEAIRAPFSEENVNKPASALENRLLRRNVAAVKEKPPSTLLIVDDISGYKAILDRSSEFMKFVYSHRHYWTSIICASHYLKNIPLYMRSIASVLVFFNIKNKKELQSIVEENALDMTQEELAELLKHATQQKYSFLSIEKKAPLITKNFAAVLYIDK